MNVMAYHFASGAAFFWGAALILLAVGASWLRVKAAFRAGARVAAIVGLLFAVVSATPLPPWAYVVWSAVVLGWLVAEAQLPRAWLLHCLRAAAILVSAGLVLLELPHHITPSIPAGEYETLYIIGDSISSGLELGEKTWPQILRESLTLPVVDLSRAGADLRSASKDVQKVKQGPAVVVLEIGGNDLMSRRTAVDFEKDLRALLGKLRDPERTLLVFELPLPPFYNAYGRIQRRLAGDFQAVLMPKRLFCKVLAGHGSTVDGLHLSAKGQMEMAAVVRDVLGRAVPARP